MRGREKNARPRGSPLSAPILVYLLRLMLSLFVKPKPLPQNRSHVTHQFIHRPLILGPAVRTSWLHPGLKKMAPGRSDRTEAVPPDTESQPQPVTTDATSEGEIAKKTTQNKKLANMPSRRSGRWVSAARPQLPKQPSTRHDGLGNDVKGKECGHRLRRASRPHKAQQERVVLRRRFPPPSTIHDAVRDPRGFVSRTPAGYLPRPRTTVPGK